MPAKHLSDITSAWLPGIEKKNIDSAEAVPTRQKGRGGEWQSQLAREAANAMARARSPEDEARIEAGYAAALERGPDFTRHRRGSGFMDAPRITVDRNAIARIKFMLEAIRRGSWKARVKGKHAGDIKHSVIEVFDALARLALKHGKVFPSLLGLCHLSTRSKQTVVNALRVLEFYGFVTRHRRIKRIRTDLGIRVVQDTNAYSVQEPNGWGLAAFKAFMGDGSESRSQAARSPDPFIFKPLQDFSARFARSETS